MLTPQEVEAYFASIGAPAVATRDAWRDAKCPWHDDRSRSFSFNVTSGGWVCQAGCGKGGLKEAAEKSGVPFPRNGAAPTPRQKAGGDVLQATYAYHDATGALAYEVLRYKRGATKTFRQRRPDGAGGWIWKMDGVTPLPYRLPELLKADPAEVVYVVEGEKDADNLAARGFTATTNHGGAGKWKDAHAHHLQGRRVVVLPDNDAPGRKHADVVAASLQGVAAEIRVLDLPGLLAKGDVSDWLAAGGTEDALDALEEKSRPWTPPAPSKAPPASNAAASEAPFTPLGHADGVYYYLTRQTMQVVGLAPAAHAKLPLLQLAPLAHWAKAYGTDNGAIAWTSAASEMMQACARRGVFDYSKIRGRGAWYEAGAPVVHLGDAVVVGGEKHPLGRAEAGGYIYPAAVPIPINYADPLDPVEAAELSALCDRLSWEKPINGRLLAGWLAVAPICGALAWRPHIWLTGAAGTGKSWVMDNIMRPILGRVGLFVQSDTTEAGIRQALGYDARPVLFDEAEGESERAQVRMQNVMALMRQSSSENGSVIVKGSISGQVKTYSIRSCFAFSSIGVGIKQHSDATRVSVLSMKRPDAATNEAQFAALRAKAAELLSPAWVGRLHARMIAAIPAVRANAETFARAAAAEIGSQRMGDQNGALLAGAYALHEDGVIGYDAARAWVAKQDWSEQTAVQETPDEVLCLQRLLQQTVRMQENGRSIDASVAEMIELCESSLDPDGNAYRTTLTRLGIKVGGEEIAIANQHPWLADVMRGTAWGDWGRVLGRLKGAQKPSHPIRFGALKARATTIPRDHISN